MSTDAAVTTPGAAKTRQWLAELALSEKAQEKWLTRAGQIIKRYMLTTTSMKRRFSLLWSNTQTILPAVYARVPAPVVSRRFKDADPVGRSASEILERSLSYSVDKRDIDGVLRACAFDFTLIARGQAWERYVPTHGDPVVEKVKVLQITTSAGLCYEDDGGKPYDEKDVKEDGEGGYFAETSFRPVVYEESVTDYVNYKDFGHSVSRTWDEVWFVWRRAYMDRAQLIERFGEQIGKACQLDWGPKDGDETQREAAGAKAAVFEVWDKRAKKALWVCSGFKDGVLDERDDPLGLDDFFPCPRPLYGTLANDSLIPTPDYVQYQDQAEEVDDLTRKIGEFEDALKVVGFYASDGKDNLETLLKSKNNTVIPVASWQSLKEGGGMNGMIEWWPIDKVVVALRECIALRQQLINDVYQITGISDILRGASDPNETAKAQGLKAQWGSMRVRDRQKEMARFARDILRIKGEIIAEHFSIDTLKAMTGVKLPMQAEKDQAQLAIQAAMLQAQGTGQPPPPPPPEVMKLLQSPSWEDVKALLEDNALRQFRIDIETDSTIEPDEQKEKQSTVELLEAIGGMVQQWGPAIEAKPEIAPMVAELIKFGVRRFRAGRELEDIVEQTMDKLAQGGAAPQQQMAPQPPPAPKGKSPEELALEGQRVANETMETRAAIAYDQQDLALRHNEQQLQAAAMARDPRPQATV